MAAPRQWSGHVAGSSSAKSVVWSVLPRHRTGSASGSARESVRVLTMLSSAVAQQVGIRKQLCLGVIVGLVIITLQDPPSASNVEADVSIAAGGCLAASFNIWTAACWATAACGAAVTGDSDGDSGDE